MKAEEWRKRKVELFRKIKELDRQLDCLAKHKVARPDPGNLRKATPEDIKKDVLVWTEYKNVLIPHVIRQPYCQGNKDQVHETYDDFWYWLDELRVEKNNNKKGDRNGN